MNGPVLIVLFLLLSLGLTVWGWVKANQRRKDLAAWSRLRGLRFEPWKDDLFDEQFPNLDFLHRGNHRYAHNLMRGQWRGYDLLAFDYHYETQHEDKRGDISRSNKHDFSAVILSCPRSLPLKPLFIRPENLLDKLGELVGLDDIDFESAEFSRAFFVSAPDKRWAYDVLHPRAMQLLLDAPRFTIQVDQFQVVAWRSRLFAVEDFIAAANLLRGLLELMPEYLLQQQASVE